MVPRPGAAAGRLRVQITEFLQMVLDLKPGQRTDALPFARRGAPFRPRAGLPRRGRMRTDVRPEEFSGRLRSQHVHGHKASPASDTDGPGPASSVAESGTGVGVGARRPRCLQQYSRGRAPLRVRGWTSTPRLVRRFRSFAAVEGRTGVQWRYRGHVAHRLPRWSRPRRDTSPEASRSAGACRRQVSTMAPAHDSLPAADAWPVPDPRRAVLQLFTTGATSGDGTTGTNAPPRARGTENLLLPSPSHVGPTVRQ